MKRFGEILRRILVSVLSFLVMIVLAIVSFYFTVFVVSAGASFAGYDPSGDFVVLSASLLVVGAILSGGLSPVLFLSRAFGPDAERSHAETQKTRNLEGQTE